jgi:hypothetical protein
MPLVLSGAGAITGLAAVGGLSSLPTGSVIQTVQATTTTGTSSTSTSFVSVGFSASITPRFNTSKILVFFNGAFYNANSGANSCIVTIYRNGSNILTSTGFYAINNNGVNMPVSCSYVDSPATTSSLTYEIYQKTNNNAAGFWFLISAETATLQLLEIAG